MRLEFVVFTLLIVLMMSLRYGQSLPIAADEAKFDYSDKIAEEHPGGGDDELPDEQVAKNPEQTEQIDGYYKPHQCKTLELAPNGEKLVAAPGDFFKIARCRVTIENELDDQSDKVNTKVEQEHLDNQKDMEDRINAEGAEFNALLMRMFEELSTTTTTKATKRPQKKVTPSSKPRRRRTTTTTTPTTTTMASDLMAEVVIDDGINNNNNNMRMDIFSDVNADFNSNNEVTIIATTTTPTTPQQLLPSTDDVSNNTPDSENNNSISSNGGRNRNHFHLTHTVGAV